MASFVLRTILIVCFFLPLGMLLGIGMVVFFHPDPTNSTEVWGIFSVTECVVAYAVFKLIQSDYRLTFC